MKFNILIIDIILFCIIVYISSLLFKDTTIDFFQECPAELRGDKGEQGTDGITGIVTSSNSKQQIIDFLKSIRKDSSGNFYVV